MSFVEYDQDFPPLREIKPKVVFDEDTIISIVSTHLGITETQMASKSRERSISYARHMSWFLLAQYTYMSIADIQRRFGNRDHSTVIAGINRIKGELKIVVDAQHDFQELENTLLSQMNS